MSNPNDCPHVAETGSHRFPYVDDSFSHAFGMHRDAGFTRCDCGACPVEHGMYDGGEP